MFLKSFLLTSFVLCCYLRFFGQPGFPYDAKWKVIDSLINKKNLPGSALIEVNKVYAAAKTEKNEAQWVKAIIYRNHLGESEDRGAYRLVAEMEREISTAPPRVAALLKSMEAEQMFRYLQWNLYRMRDRTTIASDTSADITTWTISRTEQRIRNLYLGSLENPDLLKKTPLEVFDPVLVTGSNRDLRPTLFDLLAWRALDYFQADNRFSYSSDNLLLENPVLFSEALYFMHYGFKSTDSSSNQATAIAIYQQLLRFHAKDLHLDAWIDADIHRIRFVYQYAKMADKDSLYLNALEKITTRFGTLSVTSQAWYLQAQWWNRQASTYDPLGDTSHRFDNLKAISLCEKALTNPDSSEGKSNGEQLLLKLRSRSFTINVESVDLPNQPFRALITYRNINQLFGRIIRIDETTRESLEQIGSDGKLWTGLLQRPVEKSFHQAIPETGDLQEHRVEIKMDALPVGQYALITSANADFSTSDELGLSTFFCSSIAYVKNGLDYFVVDRSSGHPLHGVKLTTFNRKYASGKYRYNPVKTYLTNANGFIHILSPRDGNYQKLEFHYGNDFLSTGEYIGHYYNHGGDEETKRKLTDYLFTDRSIYRPGQTVFFKGLLIAKDQKTKKFSAAGRQKTKIFLKDVNGQTVDSLILRSNEFGSVQGTFHLPEYLLGGEFSIYDDVTRDEQSFSVEEYKRPAFYVEFDSVKTAYRLGDTISLEGKALAYAGNAIDEAKFSYRVYRETLFPYPWMLRYFTKPAEVELAHGEGLTNAQGKFKIHFSALPDKAVSKSTHAVFKYRVETTITDVNGESRSGTSTLSAGYRSFEIVSSFPDEEQINRDSLYRIPVTTKNASGLFVKKNLTVIMYALESPRRLIRKRYWDQPDQYVMTEKEFTDLFPNDEYRDESNVKTWSVLSTVYKNMDSTRADGSISMDRKLLQSLSPGWYTLEFRATDIDGTEIINKKFVQVVVNHEKPGFLSYDHVQNESVEGEPGSTVNIQTGSDAKDLYVIRHRQQPNDSINNYSYYRLSEQVSHTALDIRESDRGGLSITDVFVINNRWYTSRHLIRVPWTNKDLMISYITWKDKTLPGSSEQWKIKIDGAKKDHAAAELLTSMYDASLDQFKMHSWNIPGIYPLFSPVDLWDAEQGFGDNRSFIKTPLYDRAGKRFYTQYDALINPGYKNRGTYFDMVLNAPMQEERVMGIELEKEDSIRAVAPKVVMTKFTSPKIVQDTEPNEKETGSGSQNPAADQFQIRKKFNETAFFLPDLKTDTQGNVEIFFTMPEALTRWKWMILAHTKDLAFGYSEKEVVTQKELMVQTNMPRFFREGDSMLLPVKIANLSQQDMNGTVQLEWLDAETYKPVDQSFGNLKRTQPFSVSASQNSVVFFPAIIPVHFTKPLLYRIIAKTDMKGIEYSDGEEAIIPVLSNRMLVTESLPINMTGKTNQHFVFDKLLKSGASSSLQNHGLTVEYITNPAWYAVQSLPFLMEFPYECAEQTFNRFYANALATHIVKGWPSIQAILEKWKHTDTTALLSNLQKNEELKTALLRETPWVLEAQNESQQKKNIALLFDLMRMRASLKSAIDKLSQIQSGGGGFPWFKGGMDDRYITQYILSGIGRLKKLNAIPAELQPAVDKIIKSGFNYLDSEINKDYENRDKRSLAGDPGPIQIQYLYMRSLFPEIEVPVNMTTAINYYRKLCIENWMRQSVYMQGMIAIYLNRIGEGKAASEILASLKENATVSLELGMYWKTVGYGYYWQEAPVETQSLLIETFRELHGEQKDIDQMKYWLLQQKHTRHWPTTKATADACYALLLGGSDWLSSHQSVSIQLGNYKVNSDKTETGTGYFKKYIPGDEMQPDMGNIQVTIQQNADSSAIGHRSNANGRLPTPSWGTVYWQYFENLDKIISAQTQLSVTKNLFVEKNGDKGPVLEAVTEKNILKPGDKLILRIIMKTDRDLEYVHLKDMRAACLEPVNVLSGYQWQGGLGYYETTKDASTSFFFDRLPKGVHVFEYPVHVTTAGNYSNGVSSLECMYAPEFSAHSEGIRIQVESK